MGKFKSTAPETYQQLIKRSLHLYRASFSRVLLFAVLLSIITFIPQLLSISIGQNIFFNLDLFSPYRLWFMAIDFASLIFFIAIVWRMRCTINGIHEPMIQDMRIGVQKIIYVFIASLIQSAFIFTSIIIIYGLLFLMSNYYSLLLQHALGIFLVAGIFIGQFILILYIYTLFLFYLPIIAIENKGIMTSLQQSFMLAWNHWWRIISLQLTPWLIFLAFYTIIQSIFSNSQQTMWFTMLLIAGFAFNIPWFAATLITQLKDLELRHKLGQ